MCLWRSVFKRLFILCSKFNMKVFCGIVILNWRWAAAKNIYLMGFAMRKCGFVVIIIFAVCSSALAFDFMGAPTAQVRGAELGFDNPPGQLAFGVDYMHSKLDIEVETLRPAV